MLVLQRQWNESVMIGNDIVDIIVADDVSLPTTTEEGDEKSK